MCKELFKGLKPVKLLLTAIVFTIISYVVHMIGAMASMGYYTMPEYFSVWSKIMMPAAGPPPVEFTLYSLVFGFIGALLFVLIYWAVRPVLKGMSELKAGATYGFGVFLIAGFPGMLSMILLINLPLFLTVEWAAEGLVIDLVCGAIVAKLMSR